MIYRRVFLICCFCIAAPTTGNASSTRGEWVSRLKMLGVALHNHNDLMRYLPEDITSGKARLSWRVALLPFVEQDYLYRQFDLMQGWDAPVNKKLLSRQDNNVYRNMGFDRPGADELSGVVMPRGPGTFWGDGTRRIFGDVKGIPSRTIVLIEVDQSHAPNWTEPRDLAFDLANPRKGLGWHWRSGFLQERGCFGVFADADVHLISENISDEQLRSLFAGESAEGLSLNWFQAMLQMPIGWVIGPSLIIALVAVVGCLLVIRTICAGKSISPGEVLWLILGAEYLVFSCFFVASYEYPLLSPWRWGNYAAYRTLVLPARLAGCAVCLVSVVRFVDARGWRIMFAGLLALMSLAALDASSPEWKRWPEEALLTMPSPFVMAFAGFVAMKLSWSYGVGESSKLRFAHWAGILFCFVPLIWFSFWWFGGYVYPAQWFLRVRD